MTCCVVCDTPLIVILPETGTQPTLENVDVSGMFTATCAVLHAYHLAYKREFYAHQKPVTHHVEHIAWQKDKGNQKMEAFNGTVRAREKVMRSLKREDSPILDGYQIFHNHVRPHQALNGKTPAEACGIEVEGENKWLTLIQNASRGRK